MKRLISLSFALALAAVPAGATTFVMVSDESLVEQADLIVRARIDRVNPQSATAAARTEVRALVDEVLKGDDPGESVRLSILGGINAAGIGLRIWGAPSFREGEEVILFLSQRRDGTYAPLHLFLGAFHELAGGAERLAVRSFGESRQITLDGSEPRPEPLRDADRFVDWIRARVADPQVAADYMVDDDAGGMRARVDAFTLLLDGDDSLPIRWKSFNPAGGKVHWRMQTGGQSGVSGGGFTQFQTALNAWKADPLTAIDLPYDGTTTNTHGFAQYDEVNALIFNDPNNDIDAGPFNCSTGGVLALGGPWYDGGVTHVFQGQTFHEALNADIMFNKNIKCFFDASGSPQKAFEEIAAHELGHTLGLGHSCGDSKSPSCGSNAALNNALMRANVHNDGRGAQITADELAATALLYGSAGSPPAAPSGLSGGPLTHTAAQIAWTDNSSNETNFHVEVKVGGGAFVDIGTVPANSTGALLGNLTAGAAISVRVRAQGSGGFSGYSNTASFNMPFSTPSCSSNSTTLCVASGRYKVQMIIRSGSPNFVNALRVVGASTANSGLFFFPPPADPNDWQVLIKVLNGCPINNNWWVFYAATTNVEFQITVTDTQSGKVKNYYNPPNTAAAVVQDTGAIAACP